RYFGRFAREAVGLCFALAAVLAAGAIWAAGGGALAWLGLAAFAAHLGWQVTRLGAATPQVALRLFRSNWHAGLLLAAGFAADCLWRVWG
ncbi:hypothetical protein, partial [Staphylococcus aureus]|uniref:hypothetical protein n=1 Tax=Staphylococcus aureus TaxID=1280 RepID=UPI00301C6983